MKHQWYLERVSESVNWNDVFPGIVLHGSSQECLSEEEAGQPEGSRLPIFVPVLNKKKNPSSFRIINASKVTLEVLVRNNLSRFFKKVYLPIFHQGSITGNNIAD